MSLLMLLSDAPIPSQQYNFLPGTLPAGLTYTNSSTTRYYFGADGLLKTAAANEAIFEFSPSTGAMLGMRWEMEARTNMARWNRDLTNAAWTKTNGTAAKDQTGLAGVANAASSFTATSANATCLQSITSASAARVTSFYLKRLTGTGTVNITQDNGTTWTAVTLTSAYQRFQVTATAADPVIGIRVVTSGDAVAFDFAQHETPATVASSPILTTTAAVTRAADVLTASAITPWYRQDEGTIVFEGIATQLNGGGLYVFSDGTNSERHLHSISGTGMSTAVTFDGGVTQQSSSTANTTTAGAVFRSAFRYKLNDFGISMNGGAVVADTAGTLPAITQLKLGASAPAGASVTMGYARRFQYFPTRLTDSQLQGLSRV